MNILSDVEEDGVPTSILSELSRTVYIFPLMYCRSLPTSPIGTASSGFTVLSQEDSAIMQTSIASVINDRDFFMVV